MRVAAVQLEARVADVEANLDACERLADAAGAEGAEAIALPEFFSTSGARRRGLQGLSLCPERNSQTDQ
jgi:predicted amidohydrolase